MRNVVALSHAIRSFIALIIILSTIPIDPFTTPVYAVSPTVVTTTALANNPNDGACSLREALQAAFS
ncbi:MAG: CSLREA domain-containing protein, partial [Caldilineaceae bacterium]|nr:CSLREA domain-containing protein [Caldilineaceae bacterium]